MAARFDEALAVGTEALTVGQGASPENAVGSHGALLLGIGFHRAEVTGVADMLRMMAAGMPGVSPYSALVPFYLSEDGRLDEAAADVTALAGRLDEVPLGPNWLTTMCFLAYATHAVGDRETASTLYERVAPMAGVHVTAGQIVFSLGPVDRYLALLAEAAGDDDRAGCHFTDAVAQARALGCTPYVALSLFEHGRSLRRTGRDPAAAEAHLTEAAQIADGHGLVLVRRKYDELTEAGA
jgi:hypothetical protein